MDDLLLRIQGKQRGLNGNSALDNSEPLPREQFLNINASDRNKLRDTEVKMSTFLVEAE